MKLRSLFLLQWSVVTVLIATSFVQSSHSQTYGPDQPPPTPPTAPTAENPPGDNDQGPIPTRSPDQLDQLLGPIALYPDPLIALILPAATVPGDVSAAANYLNQGGSLDNLDSQPWDPSVKSLARYSQVVVWMDQNMDWTEQVGSAYYAQSTDVMDSIQRLRSEARAAGTLRSTAQQQVITEGDVIEIVPAQSDQIYVPLYDPQAVYYQSGDGDEDSYIVFSDPYPTGAWLTFGFDWGNRRVWVGDYRDWHDRGRWGHPDWDRNGREVDHGRRGQDTGGAVQTGAYSPAQQGHAWQPPKNPPAVVQTGGPGHPNQFGRQGSVQSSVRQPVVQPRPIAIHSPQGSPVQHTGAGRQAPVQTPARNNPATSNPERAGAPGAPNRPEVQTPARTAPQQGYPREAPVQSRAPEVQEPGHPSAPAYNRPAPAQEPQREVAPPPRQAPAVQQPVRTGPPREAPIQSRAPEAQEPGHPSAPAYNRPAPAQEPQREVAPPPRQAPAVQQPERRESAPATHQAPASEKREPPSESKDSKDKDPNRSR